MHRVVCTLAYTDSNNNDIENLFAFKSMSLEYCVSGAVTYVMKYTTLDIELLSR